ncbi:hypothetical protein V492_04189 [Pseudogymnoascus sp. VKM F-4246]|nr:hypothetical protein V492_04189 [Pseudogymnoascus sp. VKM F-4246]
MSSNGTAGAAGGPPPVGAPLGDKQKYAAAMIKEEQEDMDRHGWDVGMSEDNWADFPRSDYTRRIGAGVILSGMVIRGRLQAAVFDTFMDLCLQGVCSLRALECPVNWNNLGGASDCHRWVGHMLGAFSCFHVNMDVVQAKWGIDWVSSWHDYHVPFVWLRTMITRSFNSLDAVFNTIRRKGLLGRIRSGYLKKLEEEDPPNPAWVADINTNTTGYWGGSGTFACWLPDNIDPGLTQLGVYDGVMALSKDFHMHRARTEMHYAVFFDIDRDAEYPEDMEGELN